ncbi:SDR family oxidoreductase [Sphingobium sp. AN558]|uniref:SDR family NAD(P)-dependent oxidoreductase n=1 Tax=Sphingobium sp. AN558 TaxID=3133442 RepID=UPI0030C495BE
MMEILAGRVALVTGGGKGIGRATCEKLAAEGARVLVVTRSAAAGEATLEAIRAAGGDADLAAIELGSPDAARAAVEAVRARYGALDILIHNAAYIPYGPIGDLPEEEWRKAMAVGPDTAFHLLKAALPMLRASRHGRAIFVSSLAAGRSVSRNLAAYGAAKGAIEAFVKAAAMELMAEGVTVNAVAPGGTMSDAVRTQMSAQTIARLASVLPARRLAECAELADVIAFVASDAARFITGQSICVDGGQSLGMDIVLDG